MANVQRAVNHAGDDSQYQIMDFQDTLSKCIEDEQKIYGQKNKPRNQEPSMFDLLSWKDGEDEIWNYTKKSKEVVDSNIGNKLKYKINKSLSHWTTENMDQYRKFAYSPSKKPVFFDLEDPASTRGKVTTHGENFISKDLAEQLAKTAHQLPHSHTNQIPKNPSEFIDKYTIQDLSSLNDVLKVLQNRALIKGGEVVKNPIAERVSEAIEKEHRRSASGAHHDGYYEGEEGEEYHEGQGEDEEESEQVEVEKMDLTNVKSRLLEKKVKSAKILDPVYEKDRLGRRQDRIKKLNETTRWLPNSAFKTYFGKAPFENYGRGNLNPTVGGPIYGDYLKSHNINPQSGGNKPEYVQVYSHADLAATRYPDMVPEPPRKCKDDFRLSQKQVDELKRRNPLTAEKFVEKPKTIVKPDLINSLRFASEENTPDNSFEEEKPKKKNLRESLKNLNKKARTIRGETTKQPELKKRFVTLAEQKAADQAYQEEQEKQKASSADVKKPAKENAPQKTAKKEQTQTKSKVTVQEQAPQKTEKPTQKAAPKSAQKHQEFDESINRPQTAESKRAKTIEKRPESRAQQEQEQEQYQERKVFNASEGVKNLMRDPETAFQNTAPQKLVTFKEAPQNRQSLKFKEAPGHETRQERPKTSHLEFGKVEELPTLLKELQKDEKLREKINEDMGGALDVNPMEPPKNYLFTLSQKETDPRYYKNVPAVWLQRIPFAGRKSGKHEDVKAIFNYSD